MQSCPSQKIERVLIFTFQSNNIYGMFGEGKDFSMS